MSRKAGRKIQRTYITEVHAQQYLATGQAITQDTVDRIRDQPWFSVCSLGKQRWFWLAYQRFIDWLEGNPPLASGYTTTKDEAMQQGRDAIGISPPDPLPQFLIAPVTNRFSRDHGHRKPWYLLKTLRLDTQERLGGQVHGTYAASYHRKLAVEQRMQKPSTDKGSAPLEFLYQHSSEVSKYDNTLRRYSIPHRIVKKTPKRVFVERRPMIPDRWQQALARGLIWYDYDVETHALDRAHLEREGYASAAGKGWWGRIFYVEPYDVWATTHCPAERIPAVRRLHPARPDFSLHGTGSEAGVSPESADGPSR